MHGVVMYRTVAFHVGYFNLSFLKHQNYIKVDKTKSQVKGKLLNKP